MAQYPMDPRYSFGGYGGGGMFGMQQGYGSGMPQRMRMPAYGSSMGGTFPQQPNPTGGFFPPPGGWNQPQAPSEKDLMAEGGAQRPPASYMSAQAIPPPPSSQMADSGLFAQPQMKAPTSGMAGMSLNDYVQSLSRGGQLADPGRDAAGMQNGTMMPGQDQPQGKGIVLAEGQGQTPGQGANPLVNGVPNGGPFNGGTTPTYLHGVTAAYLGLPGVTGQPMQQDSRMMWGIGNNGGQKGWSLVPGYNGYKG